MRVSVNGAKVEGAGSSADALGIDASEDVARNTATMKKNDLLIEEDFSS
jgi:hypothetical protein